MTTTSTRAREVLPSNQQLVIAASTATFAGITCFVVGLWLAESIDIALMPDSGAGFEAMPHVLFSLVFIWVAVPFVALWSAAAGGAACHAYLSRRVYLKKASFSLLAAIATLFGPIFALVLWRVLGPGLASLVSLPGYLALATAPCWLTLTSEDRLPKWLALLIAGTASCSILLALAFAAARFGMSG